jgi:hypothetical protein
LSIVKKNKPLLSDGHKQLRHEHAKEHKDWIEEWRKVIFLYESTSTLWDLIIESGVGRGMGTPKQLCS